MCLVSSTLKAEAFAHASSWSAFDPGANGVGTDPDGFAGATFDGRYVYFIPQLHDDATASGEVLRYDTQCASSASFDDTVCWTTYDYSAHCTAPACTDPVGYNHGVIAGQYLYLAPSSRAGNNHGEVLRYNTTAPFTTALSWEAYDPGDNGVGSDPDGFAGAVYDGQYVYFVPYHNGSFASGEVLRYNTAAPFNSAASWASFIPTNNGVGSNLRGYCGGVFDGRYVYFAPYGNEIDHPNGKVMRFDTQDASGFSNAASWQVYDVRSQLGASGGYRGAIFDGRFVYFVPHFDATATNLGGEVLRYDTQGSFSDSNAWATFDPGDNGLGTDLDGFNFAVFDGRFAYFVPYANGTTEYSGEALRYDTLQPFDTVSSWAAFDAGANSVGSDPDGYSGGTFDGRFVYFAPNYNGTEYHGEVLRYDAANPIPTISGWGLFTLAIVVLAAGTGVLRSRQIMRD